VQTNGTDVTETGTPVDAAVLIVEDDHELGELLVRLFRDEGYRPTLAPDGHTALHLALTRTYTAMVIDRGLPAIEGLDLLGRLRRRGIVTPTLILTALGSVADCVTGLDAGADDYVVKPFEVEELLARIRALVRRRSDAATTLAVGAASFDRVSRIVLTADGRTVSLSGHESELLQLLARHPARVFSRDEIVGRVFPDAETSMLVDTYVHYLRRKLGAGVVRTVRGVGYRLGSL
jgi:two-component system response regulator QseB